MIDVVENPKWINSLEFEYSDFLPFWIFVGMTLGLGIFIVVRYLYER